jgi:hypothetical protein
VLALTDQFPQGIGTHEAMDQIASLTEEYDRLYYTGIVRERQARALFRQTDFRSDDTVYTLLSYAMEWYSKAEQIRPAGNDDALLRWNACARFLNRHRNLKPAEVDRELEPVLTD